MSIKLVSAVVSTAIALGVIGASSAALADPPWARGGYRHGGPPSWAPAYGWRRKHEGFGYGRPYRESRFRYGERRFIDRY